MFSDVLRVISKRFKRSTPDKDAAVSAVLRNFPGALLLLDRQGTFLQCDAFAEAGVAPVAAELVGRNLADVVPQPTPEGAMQSLNRALHYGETSVVEYERRVADEVHLFELRISPIQSGYALAAVRDVSDRKRMEERLKEVQKMEAAGQITSGIAHDLYHLLTAIREATDLLLGLLPEQELARAEARRIRLASEQATSLARQLVHRGGSPVPSTGVDLNGFVEAIGELLGPSLSENIRIRKTLASNLPHVSIPRDQMARLVLNLILNAGDAMPEGGEISIETASVLADDSATRGPFVMLSVADTGSGIDPDVQSRVFEPYFSTKPADCGSGLGLAVVKEIVTQNGGRISVSSKPGRGSTFRVYFRAQVGGATAPVTDRERAKRSIGPILVVDDHVEVRNCLRKMLEGGGFQVLEAADGRGALTTLSGVACSVLITDLVMPEKEGLELIRQVRAEYPALRIIAISGASGGEFLEVATRLGAHEVLCKPLSSAAVLDAVERVLG